MEYSFDASVTMLDGTGTDVALIQEDTALTEAAE